MAGLGHWFQEAVLQQHFALPVLTEHSEKEKLETDAMYKLDHGGRDKEKLRASLPTLNELQEQQAAWKNDFQINSALRRKFRVCACECTACVFVCMYRKCKVGPPSFLSAWDSPHSRHKRKHLR